MVCVHCSILHALTEKYMQCFTSDRFSRVSQSLELTPIILDPKMVYVRKAVPKFKFRIERLW
jgi:hypothetical protein